MQHTRESDASRKTAGDQSAAETLVIECGLDALQSQRQAADPFQQWAHELRNQVFSIQSWAQLLQLDQLPHQRRQEGLAAIAAAAARQVELLERLVKLIEGDASPRPKPR